jgi:predicted O-linked N-acetylglucosamine transferase (SPINDLY family)
VAAPVQAPQLSEVIVLARAGRLAESEALARALLAKHADHYDATVALAMVAVARKKPTEARKNLARAISIDANGADAHLQLALIELRAGNRPQAFASLKRAKAARSPSAEVHFQLGELEREAGNRAAAIAELTTAVGIDPEHGEAQNNLGGLLRESGRGEEALGAFRKAVAARPSLALAWFNLGTVLRDRGQIPEAIDCLETSLRLDPRQAEAHYWLGNSWMGLGDAVKAIEAYRAALRLDSRLLVARWGLTMAQIVPVAKDEEETRNSRQAFSRELDKLIAWCKSNRPNEGFRAVGAQQPYYLAYQQQSNKDLLQRYGQLCVDLMRPWEAKVGLPAPPYVRGAKCKVGIVSAHFQNHSVWNAFVRGWLEHIDASKVELHLFHLGAHQDAETRFARERAAKFHGEPRDWSLWAKTIAESRLDALVYPEVGMDSTTAKLAAARLAPVQLVSWGHPETTGLPSIDHFVSAAGMEPKEAADLYSERLHLLPGLGTCCRRFSVSPARIDLAQLGVPKGARVLVCAGMPFKYGPEHDGLWVEIAKRTAPSRLLFFRNQPDGLARRLEARLRTAFAAAGLDFDSHVLFIPWQAQAAFFGVMNTADIYLDSPGFSGFNTAMQAVECGLPIVAFEGAFLRSRFASGILDALDLRDWVASTGEAFVEKVVERVADPRGLAKARAQIERNRERLFGNAQGARSMQTLLLGLTS